MCGIVGWITTDKQRCETDRSKYLYQALVAGALRGEDSTGIFLVEHAVDGKPQEASWLKNAISGNEFVQTKDYFEMTASMSHIKYAIGHNRSATVGSVSTNNAHPFQEGPITLVHNGTLSTTYTLPKTQHDLGVKVDSHAICHNLATHSVEEVVRSLDGAFALVWHDSRDDSLNMVRNAQRPLHLMPATDQDCIYIASEAEMLWWLAKRIRIGLGKIYQPTAGTWLKWLPGTLIPEQKKLDLMQYQSYSSYYGAEYDTTWASMGKAHGPAASVGGGTTTSPTQSGGRQSTLTPAQKDDRVLLGGRMRVPPMPAQINLLDAELEIEDRLLMTPLRYRRIPGRTNGIVQGMATLYGVAEKDDRYQWSVMLYGVPEDLYNRYADSGDWLVRPLIVRKLSDTDDVVVAKLVTVSPPHYSASSSETSPAGSKARSWLPGPGSSVISLEEWSRRTDHGCVQCGDHIEVEDADDIVWVNEGRDFLCVQCQLERLEEHRMSAYLQH